MFMVSELSSKMPAKSNGTPYIISNLIYGRGSRLIGLYIRVANVLHAVPKICSILNREHVDVWMMNFSSKNMSKNENVLFIVADFTNSKSDPETVVQSLKAVKEVARVEVIRPQLPGMLVNFYNFPIVDNEGRRYNLFTKTNMETMVIKLREAFGIGGLAFLYHEGRFTGHKIADRYRRWKIRSLREALNTLLIHSIAIGRFKGEIVQYTVSDKGRSGEIVIRAHNLWECEIAKEHGIREAASHFERGVIAGLLEKYAGREVKVVEQKCIAKGDPYCEFHIRLAG